VRHDTHVKPHDKEACETAARFQGDCRTEYVVSCTCGWAQGCPSFEHALAVQDRHVERPNQEGGVW
jgi:hypothetical protein